MQAPGALRCQYHRPVSGSEPTVAPRRIGLLGGTFDPPHLGHAAAALEARRLLDLDLVVLVVANDPWQKTAEARIGDADVVSPADVRLAMTRAAVVGLDGIRVDDVEIRRGGPSYTAETLAHFKAQGMQPAGGLPEAFDKFIKAESAKWVTLSKEAGVKLE